MRYAISLAPDDNDTVLATCPALPEVTTFGDDREVALLNAANAIEEALAARIADGRDIPAGDQVADPEPSVRLPVLVAMKVELYRRLRSENVTRAELARRLRWNRESVDRLFRLDHRSRTDQLEEAMRAVGLRLDVRVEAIAS